MNTKSLTKFLLVSSLILGAQGCATLFGEAEPSDPLRGSGLAAGTIDASAPTGDKQARLEVSFAENLAQRGQLVPAIKMYERARERDPGLDHHVARKVAILYDRNGNRAKALKEFQKVLAKNPDDAGLLNDIGYLYYNMGRWTEAEQHFRQAILYDKKHKRAWMNLGMCLGQQQLYDESLEAFEQVTTKAEAHSNLAFILTTQGQLERAQTEYLQALALEPGLKVARAALEKLEQSKGNSRSLPLEPTPSEYPIEQVGTDSPK